MDLDTLIANEKLGYAHRFGDKFILSRNMIKSADKSRVEGKYIVSITLNGKEETVDYLTSKDLLALQDSKRIECTWTRSRSGKAYWNHNSSYLDEEVLK
jgi:hypothetical protein